LQDRQRLEGCAVIAGKTGAQRSFEGLLAFLQRRVVCRVG
jgi:hypothetical protein